MKGHSLPGFKQKKSNVAKMETVEVQQKSGADNQNFADVNFESIKPNTTYPNKEIHDYESPVSSENTIHVATEAHDRGKPAGYNTGGQDNDPRLDVYDIGGMMVGVDADLRNNMRDEGFISAADIEDNFGFDINKEEEDAAVSKAKSLAQGHKKGADYSKKTSNANKHDLWRNSNEVDPFTGKPWDD